jgi:AcrR family transcriptional regulator
VTDASPRDRLIEEASKAFRSEGYSAANLGRIATAAGISKTTIYKHVASKADLFAMVVEASIRHSDLTDAVLKPEQDEDARDTLRRALLGMTALALSPDGLATYRMISREMPHFPELVEAYNRALAPFFQGLVRFLATQRDKGWLAISSPEWAARMLVNMVLADARREALLGRDPAPQPSQQARLVDDALELFLQGAARR